MKLRNSFSLGFAVLILIQFWPRPAAAYLDPGTGSVLLQGLIGAIAALAVTLKLYWHKFKALFRRRPSDTRPERVERDGSEVGK